jgi:hypothetical protein
MKNKTVQYFKMTDFGIGCVSSSKYPLCGSAEETVITSSVIIDPSFPTEKALTVIGNVNITGIIDPTELILTEQAAIPQVPTATQGAIWVDSTTVPASLIFTNETATNVNISGPGSDTELVFNNGGIIDGSPDMKYNPADSSIEIGVGAVATGTGNISIGTGASTAGASNNTVIGRGSITGGVTIGATMIAASSPANPIVASVGADEQVLLFGRNLDADDGGVGILTGAPGGNLRAMSTVAQAVGGLTWSYVPTTAADWDVAPASVGEALDFVAIASTITAGTFNPSFTNFGNITSATGRDVSFINVSGVVMVAMYLELNMTNVPAFLEITAATLPGGVVNVAAGTVSEANDILSGHVFQANGNVRINFGGSLPNNNVRITFMYR